ncbi:MAG: UDP-N-acetylmuramoyl-L-alanine--D-glutamate ligase [SAR86 cluster bacterium]|uniref:UDP-N-acetylmuramoylalanine--D-glutamate ligase n=1 Tax=SAR86 cluster bacterium TaxID=2030880 RepID=A0A2A5B0J1_9GAMM|nr:MAG: UDP-N-acetylmuramoyl-L-alanine--D-glutamate ligase [SAR86 cluster bacterium]
MAIESDERFIVIVGLGGTGLSCARYFSGLGEKFKIIDSRENPPGLLELKQSMPEVECELGKFSPQTLLRARQIVVSPGVSIKTREIADAIAAGVPVTGDIDIFSKQVDRPIIAVTGSNGKSTVVAILVEILKKSGIKFGLGGNLDGENFKPALDLLAEEKKDLYVLELSSFQLETTENLGAEVVSILNLSEDHMDRYDNLEDYLRAKQRIFRGCKQVVINRDEQYSYPDAEREIPVWDFGFGRPGINGFGLLEENGDQYLAYQYEKIVSVSELKVIGQHNISNVLAAIALAMAVDVELDSIKKAITEFTGLPHRCQWVADVSGIEFYNDSKGTNVGATVAAVEGLGQRISGHIILIAGGVGKGADFSSLVPVINKWGKEVVLIGQDATEMAASFSPDIKTHFANDMQDAVKLAMEHAAVGDAVLLSPACASFDMFDNFQHRGQSFIRCVETLQ